MRRELSQSKKPRRWISPYSEATESYGGSDSWKRAGMAGFTVGSGYTGSLNYHGKPLDTAVWVKLSSPGFPRHPLPGERGMWTSFLEDPQGLQEWSLMMDYQAGDVGLAQHITRSSLYYKLLWQIQDLHWIEEEGSWGLCAASMSKLEL